MVGKGASEDDRIDLCADALVLQWAADILRKRYPDMFRTEGVIREPIAFLESQSAAWWREAQWRD